MIKDSLTLYCISNFNTEIKTINHNHYINTIPIISGSYFLSQEQKLSLSKNLESQEHILDDTLENISSLNPWFSDLTSVFWIYKNSNNFFIGNRQYKRNFDFPEDFNIEENVLYATSPLDFGMSIENQWNCCGEPTICLNIFDVLRELSIDNKIPIKIDMLNSTLESHIFYADNMILGQKEVYIQYCDLFFEIVFAMWEKTKEFCLNRAGIYDKNVCLEDIDKKINFEKYNMRYLGWSGERINTLILSNFEYFFGKKIQLKTIPRIVY